MGTDSLPRRTFARKIVTMRGYGRDEAITEIVSVDAVDRAEAARRYDIAMRQGAKRSVGQQRRHREAARHREEATELAAQRAVECRALVLLLAQRGGVFQCPEQLKDVSAHAGWGPWIGAASTGRAYTAFVLPLHRDGLLDEARDDDDRLVGYRLTDAGRREIERTPFRLRPSPGLPPEPAPDPTTTDDGRIGHE